jgi:hypothetical protein
MWHNVCHGSAAAGLACQIREDKLSLYDKPVFRNPYPDPGAPAPELPEDAAPVSAALSRFGSCRWRKAPENGTPACCGHRDVLPLTGANGFDAEAWCPGCAFYKLRRAPKKRDYFADRY